MKIEVQHHCSDFNSYRAARVKSLFNAEKGCDWEKTVELPIEDREWQIGLIVGPSGSGKTSIGNKIFKEPIYDLYSGWDKDKPIVDCIAPDGDFNTVTGMLSAVGLGDVPAWLRPFHVLSNGEKFRAGLARLACERPRHAVVDEFTSVIDRQIAKVGAAAFSKTWRRGSGQIVLLSCHYDIIEWLQPDWVYDTAEARFYDRDCLRQRPKLELQIYKVRGTIFPRLFKQHYYLDLPMPVAAEYFVGFVGGEPVCHLAVTPLFTAKAYRSTRLVVLPEWQGIGVGTKFLAAEMFVKAKGHTLWCEGYRCDLAIAPLLTVKVSDEELKEANWGTLIFHPSPLPYGRGASSIKWAYKRGEPITAATWFWADSGYDTGDICEQEIVKIDYGMRPRIFYEQEIIPAMLRTLGRCLDNIEKGVIRRILQIEAYSTYDKKL